jgi:hypothetical protein
MVTRRKAVTTITLCRPARLTNHTTGQDGQSDPIELSAIRPIELLDTENPSNACVGGIFVNGLRIVVGDHPGCRS